MESEVRELNMPRLFADPVKAVQWRVPWCPYDYAASDWETGMGLGVTGEVPTVGRDMTTSKKRLVAYCLLCSYSNIRSMLVWSIWMLENDVDGRSIDFNALVGSLCKTRLLF